MKSPHSGDTALLPWILLAVLSLVWGSSFILMKRGLAAFAPVELAALRVLISGVALTPFAVRAWKTLDKKLLRYFVFCGVAGNGLPAIFFATAQQELHSSTNALLNSLTPVFTLLAGLAFFGFHARRAQIIGVGAGFLGATALVVAAQGELSPDVSWYVALPVLATIGYGFNANIVSRYLKTVPPMTINSLSLLSASLLFLPYLLLSGFFTSGLPAARANPAFLPAFLSVFTLSILGTAISNALYTKLVQISSPVFSSSVTYLIPIVALAWGIWDGESLTALHFLGITIILLGIYLVNKR
jgi:drug/metabolite transporter (DMT)-like permease